MLLYEPLRLHHFMLLYEPLRLHHFMLIYELLGYTTLCYMNL